MPITNFLSLSDHYKNVDASRDAAQNRELRDMQINRANESQDALRTLRDLYKENATPSPDGRTDIGFEKVALGMSQAGYGDYAPEIVAKGQSHRKAVMAEGAEVVEVVGKIIGGVKPGDARSAAAAKNTALQFGVPKEVVDQMPQVFTADDIYRLRSAAAKASSARGGSLPSTEPMDDPNAPWRHITNSKKRDDAKIRFGVAADTRINKATEEANDAQAMNDDLDRFIFLNERSTTGPWFHAPGAKTVASLSGDYAEMSSIQDKLTPRMRQGMPGAASDRDVAMFRSATVGLAKGEESNKNVALALKIANNNIIEKTAFISSYIAERGHDRGADAEWKKYLNANPIFDSRAPKGSFKLNTNRKSYSEWASKGDGDISFIGLE